MQKPIFLDTTLRDGEQTPGVYFTHDEKIHIAKALDQIGVEIIEAGIPSMGYEERSCLKALRQLNLKAEILSWNRLLEVDVKNSLEAEVTAIHVSVPTSDLMIEKKMGKKREWILSQMETVFAFAIREGAILSFGAEDASRTNPAFLKHIFQSAQDLGAKRVRFADTLGIMTPLQVAESIAYLSDGLSIPIDYHGHNDFGLATANALSAWENGAKVISCSVLGLGERAGNTSIEEFAGILRYLKGTMPDFDFVTLKKLCNDIASWTGSAIPDRKPIIGENIYSHESGIHVDGILKEPSTYEFFSPELMGERRRLVLGKHSGRKAVRYLAEERGYSITDGLIDEFLCDMRSRMARSGNVDATALFERYLNFYGERRM